jgi:uncharacterized cupredoxin-like copper-binding protein
MFHSRLRLAALFTASAALLLGACGVTASTTTTIVAGDGQGMGSTFGEPADPADADRTVEIVASDDFRFDPTNVTVEVGDTVTFRIVNAGQVPHDFTLGDQATQDEHEAEMAENHGMAMPDEANAVTVAAAETKELTWRFTEPGTVLIGCHQPAHYAAGMKGEIAVQS